MAHELQERYSSLILAKLRKELVLKDGIVFNNDYEGDPVAGARTGDWSACADLQLLVSCAARGPVTCASVTNAGEGEGCLCLPGLMCMGTR